MRREEGGVHDQKSRNGVEWKYSYQLTVRALPARGHTESGRTETGAVRGTKKKKKKKDKRWPVVGLTDHRGLGYRL